jgi:outer membrane lipoprotein-sorting protein
MIYFFSFLKVAFVIFATVGMAKPARTQSASAIVTELESLYLKGEGIAATFSLGSEKEIKLLVALHSPKYKLETSQEVIVNDGAVVHRLNNLRKEVVLDYARKKNVAGSPVDLFNFSSNYTAKLISSKGNTYSLQLTPKASIAELYKQAEIKNLVFDLKRSAKGKPLQVVSITATGKAAKRKVTDVVIAPVMKFMGGEFDFVSPKGAKVIDLTEE